MVACISRCGYCRLNVNCVQFLRQSGSDPLLVWESIRAYDCSTDRLSEFDGKRSSDLCGCQNIVLVGPIWIFLYAKYSFDVIDILQNSILHPAVFVLPMVDLFLCGINKSNRLYVWKGLRLSSRGMILLVLVCTHLQSKFYL